MRISRKTGVTLLLAMVLGSGLAAWDAWHPDRCSRYLRGELSLPSTQEVEMAGETVYVPCSDWYARQDAGVQTACAVEFATLAVLLVLGVGDYLNWRRVRMGLPRLEE